ncbi:hypothetical protein GALMADRAFT_229942 [Galerina marginata CBS 339.88]|uniref:Uncharacterized protein n=1 Tax=Galerina marginata (strain CBS 339.88) TaxID=685588 RepID=A0A067SHX9_GALM3|nr:hypothetical protein GALMADRAFT_229942 [Galerina marginata CBS 339.88]
MLVLGVTGFSWVLFWWVCLILAMIRGFVLLFVLAQPFFTAVVGSNRLLSQHLRTWTPRLENTVSRVTTTAAVCILVHTAIHGFRFIGIFTLCMTSLFCTLTYIVVLHEATEPLGVRMLFSILPCIFVFATLGSFIWLLKVVHSFVKPAVYWYQGKMAWGDTLAGL